MEIKINDYWEPDHFRALSEDNYNVSRSCEYEKNGMHHIHTASEFLFVEEGSAEYYVVGKKYLLEKGDIMVIGGQEHHQRRLLGLPFLRYGLSVRPSYYESLNLGEDLKKVFLTPSQQAFQEHYKHVDEQIFLRVTGLIKELYEEQEIHQPFRSMMERSIITEITVLLFNIVRVCEAAKLLENTNESVTAIAAKCGYDSVNTFLRQFKAVMETTPLQYRKAIHELFKRNKEETQRL